MIVVTTNAVFGDAEDYLRVRTEFKLLPLPSAMRSAVRREGCRMPREPCSTVNRRYRGINCVKDAAITLACCTRKKSIGEAWVVDFELTQEEANDFISIQKRSLATDPVFIPLSVPLSDLSGSVEFQLDVRCARIDLKKGTNQTRLRKTIVLVRLDYGGAPHRNPDGEEVPCPHIHIYKPGYGDKWAQPISDREFKNIGDFWQTLDDFMTFCNITDRPVFQGALFDD